MTERWSALEIANELGLKKPTTEQQEIIQAPRAPALVVAGAGSGKTETMALRVLWLVANGFASPAEVLGLTFTRKAAGELSVRMRDRIAGLRLEGMVPERDPSGDPDPTAELLDAPTVSTYNSFASTIFREHAPLVGYDGDAVVLGEAAAWLLARDVVIASTDLRLADANQSVDRVASAVHRLSNAIGENVSDLDSIELMGTEFAELVGLEPGGTGAYAEVETKLVRAVAPLPALVGAVREFARRKQERGYLEFSDQVSIALRIVEQHPHVGADLRSRYSFVILDEYQDTSVVQTRLLARLFGDHPVMAVGDPHQSIYGWRGASAANLGQFGNWFGANTTFPLSTSWRNPVAVLEAANLLIEPLASAAVVPVATLQPQPEAGTDAIDMRYPQTVTEEAAEVAGWFARLLKDPSLARRAAPGHPGERTPPTAALLLRSRATLEHFTQAFRKAEVPYHVLGVGGLLSEPVIADLVAALAVIDDATAGVELIRLLTGSRWRIGTADIAALRELGRWIERRDLKQQKLDPDVHESMRRSVADDDAVSLVGALDFLANDVKDGHRALGGFSEAGRERMREAGRLFARLRRSAALDLADLIALVVQSLDLDIEALANDARPGSSRVFEAFYDAVDSFRQLGTGADLGAFLGWLREAESRDRLSPRSDPPEPGRVQVLTIHGAKGLEWDLVAVPRMVEGELPQGARDTGAWVAFGELPYEFRGDADALPVFGWRSATTRKEVMAAFAAFKAEVRERQLEEDRRLAYVSVTRAQRRLLLSGSFWSSQKWPRPPSTFLEPLMAAGVIPELAREPDLADNPLIGEPDAFPWPRDPLGGRRPRVERAAELVRSAPRGQAGDWQKQLELLLVERRLHLAGPPPITPPDRIPASRFHEYVTEPADTLEQLRRPMPERPYRATRLGTVFHAWVENRAAPEALDDELDLLASEADGELVAADAAQLAELQHTFESSPWASRHPVEVEREIHLPFDGRIVICKIDAIYESTPDANGPRFEVVDWKTGKGPKDADDLERKQLQLALYRLAYAKWAGVPVEQIDAAFYFVAENRIVEPTHIDSEEELLARWRAVFGAARENS